MSSLCGAVDKHGNVCQGVWRHGGACWDLISVAERHATINKRLEALEKVAHSPTNVAAALGDLQVRLVVLELWALRSEASGVIDERLAELEAGAPNTEAPARAAALLDTEFVEAMARHTHAGNSRAGREPDDWRAPKNLAGFLEARTNALLRHLAALGSAAGREDDTGESHWAAVACNAMMLHVLTKKD